MMRESWFHPTLNLENIDEECGQLDYIVGKGRKIDAEIAMSNNFAFGGINTSLVLKQYI
jgi:3-oxoacyl-[acyl-carrier-protein] synthase II